MKFGRNDAVIAVVISMMTLAAYMQLGHSAFVNFDDNTYVYENLNVLGGLSLHDIKWAFTTGSNGNWHPLTWLTHMLDLELFGLNAGKQHLVNVALHIANSILLFFFIRLSTGTFWRAAFVSAAFAWHPMHVESVAWIAERKDVLSMFFCLLTLLAYNYYAAKPGQLTYLLTLVLFALGLMSKSMLVTLPFLLLLLDFWPLRRVLAGGKPDVESDRNPKVSVKRLVIEKIPFFALSGIISYVAYCTQKAAGATTGLQVAVSERLSIVPLSYCRYVLKLLWPAKLAVFYPYESNVPLWELALSVLCLVVISAAAIIWFRNKPWMFIGWFWFVGTLVPVIGIVQVGGQSMADRYSYLPSVGLFIAAVWWLSDLAVERVLAKYLISGAMTLCLAVWLYLTWHQATYWRSSETLFRHELECAQDNPNAEYNLGHALYDQGRLDEAIEYYKRTLKFNAPYFLYMANNNIGMCLSMQGKLAEGNKYFKEAIRLNDEPWFQHINYAYNLSVLGDKETALAECSRAIEIAPNEPKPHYTKGLIYMEDGRFKEALPEFEETVRLAPGDELGHVKYAAVLNALGDTASAVTEYSRALSIKPDDVTALNNLAWIRAANSRDEFRNGAEAVRLAERACAITRNSKSFVLGTLAAAYAEAGNYAEAVATAGKAHDVAVANGEKAIADVNEQLIELYRAGKPYHEAPPSQPSPAP